MNRLPQLVLWVTAVAAVCCFGSHEENSSASNPTQKLSLTKNRMVSLHQPSKPEVSCIIGSSCSWVTSTDSFGKPDWVLSSIGVLVSQERQQMLLENSSSHGDVEGDIFLLNTSRLPDRCEFSLQSPILPGSLDSCLLELAICSQDALPLLQRFTVEIRYVETNKNTIISLRVGHEENAGMKWKYLVAQIGQIERPFTITLVYSNCGAQEVGVVAVGSLQLRNCFHALLCLIFIWEKRKNNWTYAESNNKDEKSLYPDYFII